MNSTILLWSFLAASIKVPQCPTELGPEAVPVRAAQQGWRGVAPSRLVLSRAGVVISAPDVHPRAELRGDDSHNKHGSRTAFSGLAAEPQKWLICGYGGGGEIEQAYPLPAAVDRCVIRTSPNQFNGNDVVVACDGGAAKR